MSAINAGDVVRLKSGGPKMTVQQTGKLRTGGPEHAWCQWFLEGEMKKGTFALESLEKVGEEDNGNS